MLNINLSYILYLLYRGVFDFFSFLVNPVLSPELANLLARVWLICFILMWPFVFGTFFFLKKTFGIWKKQHEDVYGPSHKPLIDALVPPVPAPIQNEAWSKITTLISSDNPNDWKLAVLEADKILEMIVSTFAVPGDNLGEKMRQIERGDFQTLEEAWQAHKVRNKIAHEHNFHLSWREAKQTIDNYTKVFKEFDFI